MKIAISAKGKDLNAPIDPRFGRASGFIVYDTEAGSYEYLSNQEGVFANQGAGPQTAQKLAGAGVQGVISGHVGPKAYAAVTAGDMEIYLFDQGNSVQDAVSAFKRGELTPSKGADKPGHW